MHCQWCGRRVQPTPSGTWWGLRHRESEWRSSRVRYFVGLAPRGTQTCAHLIVGKVKKEEQSVLQSTLLFYEQPVIQGTLFFE